MRDFYALQVIRSTPLRDLSIEQVFLLELHKFMTDLRIAVNELRIRGGRSYRLPHLQYLVGRIHGHVFGLSSHLIYRGSLCDGGTVDQARDAAMAEADYLVNEYIEGVA